MEVLIQPLQKAIDVEPGANLLEALHSAQVPMSYSCMAGRCGTCRCRVIAGDVLDAGRIEQNPLEGDASYVLACQSYLTEPCTIEIPEPDEVVVHPAWTVKTWVQAIEPLAHDTRRLVLRLSRPVEFSPGQYARVEFSPRLGRPYSMASRSGTSELEFHVRTIAGGRASSFIAEQLKPDDPVRVSGPLGNAFLRRKHTGPMLCVAGGTGLAPILAIVREALAEGMPHPIHLYVGARSGRDVYGTDWLSALGRDHPALNLNIVVASGAERGQRRGFVTEAIERDLASLTGWSAYLFGSPPMVEAAALLVRQKGIDPASIHTEAFYTQPN